MAEFRTSWLLLARVAARAVRCTGLAALLGFGAVAAADPCQVPDDGSGSVSLPPQGCAYLSPDEVHMIIDGLPPGTEIELGAIHIDFICRKQPGGGGNTNHCGEPGGPLGGEQEQFNSAVVLRLNGTGGLAGFQRNLVIPNVLCQTATGPHPPGSGAVSFLTQMSVLQGQITGDPDFDLLRITAGDAFGLPSPGQTTLTPLPGSMWQVDSFFDITYRIDFVGAPGGPLGGMSGSTVGTIRMQAQAPPGSDCIAPGNDCWATPCGSTHYGFSATPIPADFFGPGSEPFTGIVELGGATGFTDTVMRRLMPLCFGANLPSTATVPIELVQLDLKSCKPIEVLYDDGTTKLWDVKVGLSPTPASPGSLTATKTHPNGGTYDTTFFVRPIFSFSDGMVVLVFDPGTEFQMTSTGQPWAHQAPVHHCSPDFVPGHNGDPTAPCCEEQCHAGPAPDHEHCTIPPECQQCPKVCEPQADGQGCVLGTCDDPLSECRAHCAQYNPSTGDSRVIDCNCVPESSCHVVRQTSPGGAGLRGGTNPCEVTDNGSGTVTLPPAGCEYLSPDDVHLIIDGLPPGTTLNLAANHKSFICGEQGTPSAVCTTATIPPGFCEEPGGSLGGHHDCFDSQLELQIQGTGALAGYNRTLSVPLSTEIHTGPRTPGDAVQSFPTDMFRQFGQIAGDPDFDLLRVVAGTDFGLPSPGHTTLTQLPGGNWAVESFFDITYRIDFVGAPGGPFAGMSGSTTSTIRMSTGVPLACAGLCPPGTSCEERRTVNTDGTVIVCCDCVSTLPPCHPADVNCDGAVNAGDLLSVRAPGTWQSVGPPGFARADVNKDGAVNAGDLLSIRAPGTWQTATGPCACTP
jgi:hypothetical protein